MLLRFAAVVVAARSCGRGVHLPAERGGPRVEERRARVVAQLGHAVWWRLVFLAFVLALSMAFVCAVLRSLTDCSYVPVERQHELLCRELAQAREGHCSDGGVYTYVYTSVATVNPPMDSDDPCADPRCTLYVILKKKTSMRPHRRIYPLTTHPRAPGPGRRRGAGGGRGRGRAAPR